MKNVGGVAEINLTNSTRDTTFIPASSHVDYVKALIAVGADVNVTDSDGWIVFLSTGENGLTDCLKELLKLVINWMLQTVRVTQLWYLQVQREMSTWKWNWCHCLNFRRHGRTRAEVNSRFLRSKLTLWERLAAKESFHITQTQTQIPTRYFCLGQESESEVVFVSESCIILNRYLLKQKTVTGLVMHLTSFLFLRANKTETRNRFYLQQELTVCRSICRSPPPPLTSPCHAYPPAPLWTDRHV